MTSVFFIQPIGQKPLLGGRVHVDALAMGYIKNIAGRGGDGDARSLNMILI